MKTKVMTGRQLYDYYVRQTTEYASLVKMLLYAVGNEETAYSILERCFNEKKRLYACYPGFDEITCSQLDQNDNVEPIGEIPDGYLYLIPNEWYEKKNIVDETIENYVGWGFGFGGFKLGYTHDVNGVIEKLKDIVDTTKSIDKLTKCVLFLNKVKLSVLQHNGNFNCNEVEKLDAIELISSYKELIQEKIQSMESDVDNRSFDRSVFPKELQTEKAKALFQKAISAGLVESNGGYYKWIGGTGQLLAYFTEKANKYLNLKSKLDSNGKQTINWKAFEIAFNTPGLKNKKQDWMKLNLKFTPSGYEKVDMIFD